MTLTICAMPECQTTAGCQCEKKAEDRAWATIVEGRYKNRSIESDLTEAREIMEPFVRWLDFVESHWRSVHDQTIVSGDTRSAVTVGHLRRARSFLDRTGK